MTTLNQFKNLTNRMEGATSRGGATVVDSEVRALRIKFDELSQGDKTAARKFLEGKTNPAFAPLLKAANNYKS